MSRQVWGTFSVKDHCEPGAFVAEVMLYDRLVVPVPPDDDDEERKRWTMNNWQPERLDVLRGILKERIREVPWTKYRQESWKNRYEAGKGVANETGDWAFAATRTELLSDLPPNVTGVQAVTNYTSVDEFENEVGLHQTLEMPQYGGAAMAILGHEFLVPNDPKWSYEDLLREARDLSSEPVFRRKRASFWRWQREFLGEKGITDQSAIRDAVDEMQYLLDAEQALIRRKHIKTGTQFAFLVGSITLGMLAAPLAPLAIGGAFLSVGQFVTDKLLEESKDDSNKPVALLRDIRKHFGWK